MLYKLIELVKSNQFLYDPQHRNYGNKLLTQDTWEKIAKEAGFESGKLAKVAWAKLRKNHRDSIRQRRKNIYTNKGHWKWEAQMEFLKPYIKLDGEIYDEKIENPLDQVTESSSSSSSTCRPPLLDIGHSNHVPTETVWGKVMVVDSEHECSDEEVSSIITEERVSDKIHIDFQSFNIDRLSELPRTKDLIIIGEKMTDDLENNDVGASMTDIDIKVVRNDDKSPSENVEEKDSVKSRETDNISNDSNEEYDDLKTFFDAMYTTVKDMPPLTRLMLKKSIFNLVTQEEESILKQSILSKK